MAILHITVGDVLFFGALAIVVFLFAFAWVWERAEKIIRRMMGRGGRR